MRIRSPLAEALARLPIPPSSTPHLSRCTSLSSRCLSPILYHPRATVFRQVVEPSTLEEPTGSKSQEAGFPCDPVTGTLSYDGHTSCEQLL